MKPIGVEGGVLATKDEATVHGMFFGAKEICIISDRGWKVHGCLGLGDEALSAKDGVVF